MVGAENVVFEQFKYLFEYIGNRAVCCGKTGSGQKAPSDNEYILGF